MAALQEERQMLRIEQLTQLVGEEGEEENGDRDIAAVWQALKFEDEAVWHGPQPSGSRVLSCAPTAGEVSAKTPSPVRRSAELRKRPASRSWVDGVFAEMCAADAQHVAGAHQERLGELLGPNMSETGTAVAYATQYKRQRWSVEDVGSALQQCDLNSATTWTLGASCSPLPRGGAHAGSPSAPSARLMRHTRKQAARRERRQLVRACRDTDVHALENVLSGTLLSKE